MMVDEMKDDEYHFSDDQSGDVFDEEMSSTSAGGDLMSKVTGLMASATFKRNVLIGVGGFIALLVIYKFIGSFLGGKKPKLQVAKPAITAPVVTPTVEAKPQMDSTPQMAQADPDVIRKLSMLQRGNDSTTRKIGSINNNVESLQNSLQGIGGKISMLNQSIAMLAEQVRMQQMQIAKLKEKPKKKPKPQAKSMPKVSYNIQAVIPGRAWLMSTRNKTITVREGSRIPGYGVVKYIDPHHGVVLMSSGKRFTFSASDY